MSQFYCRNTQIVLMLLVSLGFMWAFRGAIQKVPFGYDESDYMSAARKGLVENYIETSSMNLVAFTKIGLRTVRGEFPARSLSEYIRGLGDLGFYRHYHGPLYFYLLSFASAASGESEYATRYMGLVIHALTFLTIVIGVQFVFGRESWFAAWMAGVCYLFLVNNIWTADELSSHVLFMWLSLLALLGIANFVAKPSRGTFYASLTLCMVAFCSQEYAVLLFFSLLVGVFLVRRNFFVAWTRLDTKKFLLTSAAICLGVAILLWPAGVFKGTIIEGYTNLVYLAAFRAGAFGKTGPLEIWHKRFLYQTADFAIATLFLIAAAILIWRSPKWKAVVPILLFSLILLATTLKNTADAPRYLSAIFAPLYVSGAVLLADLFRRVKPIVLVAMITLGACGLGYSAWTNTVARYQTPRPPGEVEKLLALIKAEPGQSILVPAGYKPTLSYYLPGRNIHGYLPSEDQAAIRAEAIEKKYGVVCAYGWRALPGAVLLDIPAGAGQLMCTAP